MISLLDRFNQLTKSAAPRDFKLSSPAPFTMELTPAKPMDGPTMVLAGIHGDEIGAVAGLISWLEKLLEHNHSHKIPANGLICAIGNPEAIAKGQRYIDRDLNRCFAFESSDLEAHRARQLEELLDRSSNMIDLHQTSHTTRTPFFVFRYQKSSHSMAHYLAEDLPIVTYWSGKFADSGLTTTAYMAKHRKPATTIELGTKGICAESEQLAHSILDRLHSLSKRTEIPEAAWQQVCTWRFTEKGPFRGYQLRDDLDNFLHVNSGEHLGKFNDKDLLSPMDGWILFPKHRKSAVVAEHDLDKELEVFRMITPLNKEEIKQLTCHL